MGFVLCRLFGFILSIILCFEVHRLSVMDGFLYSSWVVLHRFGSYKLFARY